MGLGLWLFEGAFKTAIRVTSVVHELRGDEEGQRDCARHLKDIDTRNENVELISAAATLAKRDGVSLREVCRKLDPSLPEALVEEFERMTGL